MGQGYRTHRQGDDRMAAEIKSLRRQLRKQANPGNINHSIIGGVGGSMQSGDFDGDPINSDFGTLGWYVGAGDGAGSLAVFNTLDLRNQIIGNDALTNPVSVDGGGSSNLSFAIATSPGYPGVVRTTVTLSPPAWVAKAVVLGIGDATGTNGSGTLGYLCGAVVINGTPGGTQEQGVAAGDTGTVTVSAMRVLNPSGTLTVTMNVFSETSTFGSNANNQANLNVIAVYLRS